MAKEMNFKYKIQRYQTDAVNALCDVFKGQPYVDNIEYCMDLGLKNKKGYEQITINNSGYCIDQGLKSKKEYEQITINNISSAFRNYELTLSDTQLQSNINEIQRKNGIKESLELSKDLGKVSLDIEMETGTGKTYVYIKTIFELNKLYGFSKFIIVVPSIAIREGIYKAFEDTREHFMEHYKKKARFFIYNSNKLYDIEQFSSSNSIQIMIINSQAFNSRGEDLRRIYEKLDSFQSRKPIDVIAANNPIIILDEPQKLSGSATQESLKKFNPLFSINYSATHKIQHNLIYVLDALDAYNKKIVKKIAVKGIEVKNLRGTGKYLYLEDIILSSHKPPMAKIELEISYKKSINRETRILEVGDNLFIVSNRMEQYRNGFVIKEIDPQKNKVIFINDNEIEIGSVVGDQSAKNLRRIQIRETIISHFEKEKNLYYKGIKTLSLFFIDEVAKYRQYNLEGIETKGPYAEIFEEEYNRIVSDYITIDPNDAYSNYLKNIKTEETHKGYFSIDKNKRLVDPKIKRTGENKGLSDDISAYDLILKNKKRLLSFEEPTRFIFSHSALREGWDNPNIFQICTLKHSDSTVQKHQEVGRGLRLCVNQNGERIDSSIPGIDVHSINKLTVIASESYKEFVSGLQESIKEDLYERPTKANIEYFLNKTVKTIEGNITITPQIATEINYYLISNRYVDAKGNLTQIYYDTVDNNSSLAEFPSELKYIEEPIKQLLQKVYKYDALDNMIVNDKESTLKENPVNENINKTEFKNLWESISKKSIYTVDFDSKELIENSIEAVNNKLNVSEIIYYIQSGEQEDQLEIDRLKKGEAFKNYSTRLDTIKTSADSSIKYDLIGKIAEQTTLTRLSISKILKGIRVDAFTMYKRNPEEFINKVSFLINEQKASVIVNHIEYNLLDESYKTSIFTEEKKTVSFANAYRANKHVCDFVFTDGIAVKSVERNFAEALDNSDEVCVYAKLPKGFTIPTPVGNYTPDWAIAFYEGKVKHIYFVAETKGSMSSLDIRGIEQAKINCCKKLFSQCLSKNNIKYDVVNNFDDLMNIINN